MRQEPCVSIKERKKTSVGRLTPCEIGSDINAVLVTRGEYRLSVALEVLHSVVIGKGLLQRHGVLVLDGKAVLRHTIDNQ